MDNNCDGAVDEGLNCPLWTSRPQTFRSQVRVQPRCKHPLLSHRKAKKSEVRGDPRAVGSLAIGPESIGAAAVDLSIVDCADLAHDPASGYRGAGEPEWRWHEAFVDAVVDAFKCLGWRYVSVSYAAGQLSDRDGFVSD